MLYSYSPYHNLKKGVTYPATLCVTADHDDRVVPSHTFKFIAELQYCQGGSAPVLARIDTKAGHYASGTSTFDVQVQDDGGTANGGQDTSAISTFTATALAQLAPFIVNTTDDTVDAHPGDGRALDANGNISLRSAIMEGNLANLPVTITFNLANPSTIYLDPAYGALPALTNDFTIDGTGITIDAGDNSGIFYVTSNATAEIDNFSLTNTANADAVSNDGSLTMDNVTLTNAQAGGMNNTGTEILNSPEITNSRRGGSGGAINNTGNLTVNNGWFASDAATGFAAGGGAINSTGATASLTISGGSYLSNQAGPGPGRQGGRGGAICVSGGTATITNAQVYFNWAQLGGGIYTTANTTIGAGCEIMCNWAGLGGGVCNEGRGTLTVNGGAQIYANTAGNAGGGIYNNGTLNMTNAVLYLNEARYSGGALYAEGGVATLTDTSVTSNESTDADGSWGGAFLVSAAGTVTLQNGCTVSGNTAEYGNGAYVASGGTLTANPNNNTWGANDDIVRED